MNRALLEKNLVIVLFILVMIVFSLAERDSKKIEKFYTASKLIQEGSNLATTEITGNTSLRN
jgi:hypothetical protein